MNKKRFEPPRSLKGSDLPDVLVGEGEHPISLDISAVKEDFAWILDMTNFLRTTNLKCRDCADFPCHRFPDPEQKIGFCFIAKSQDYGSS